MKYPVYNQHGEEVGTVLLPKSIFEVEANNDLIHQIAVSQSANRRRVIASTKDRAQVSGGGKKPWKQKGTGRARHGSIRSPLWRKGGVTFGPLKERNFTLTVPKKMKKKALFMILSAKASEKLIVVLDELKADKPKTKEISVLFKTLRVKIDNFKKGSTLMILPKADKNLYLSARNIDGLTISEARNINALDLLSVKYLIMPKQSIKAIEETFLK
ncbi:MAG: 50S ribosomal protein L4 [Patescibacteria group bacterium]|nr:50S ribosomal protein L4 [Patescibacteria group bacterium]MBU1876969.1 50S ribosomal protein L4 [Patescibacteria group bacterium]